MFGKINDKQDISDKNAPRLVPNFKFVAAPYGNEETSEEALFLLINDSYNEKKKIKLEQYVNTYKDKLYTKYLVIVNKYYDDLINNKI
jgi:predicted metal-dependent hydrolase